MAIRKTSRVLCRSSMVVVGLVSLWCSCAVVPPGHRAVLLTATHGLQRDLLPEGTHVVAPWNRVDVFDLRGQEQDEDIWALTADGAPLEARASLVTYRLVPDQLAQLDREIGPDYYRVIVEPIVRSTVRKVMARYQASQLTSQNILAAQREIGREASERLLPLHVVLESVDLRTMVVQSDSFYAVVLATASAEQVALAGPALVELARRRAEGQHEEALSIANAHARIAPTLTAAALDEEAGRAEGALLSSPHAHVVVAPPGQAVRLEVDQ